MTFTLIAMDPTYDYLPGGVFDAYGSAQAVTALARLAAEADLVILTRDWHPDNHFSFTDEPRYTDHSWPPHGVQGTKGAKIFPALRKQADYVVSKGMNRNPPDDYSAFTAKTLRPVEHLHEILGQHRTDEIVIGGFLFEIGVKFTAFDANALGWWHKVIIPMDTVGTLASESDNVTTTIGLRRAGIEVRESFHG